ncbi:nuclear transport factor 2 family protein [Streptomyces sp. NPDC012693]|uniref:nuclear transport factor 2 family protein n=1 Tax=Streptomyces sp. NPDC012693 TaxID=3364844 RepID=UPI00367A16E2
MTDTYAPSQTGLYLAAQAFYARQMQALDNGRFEEYAATFTEDGTFQHTPGVEPARGRAGIVAELRRFHEQFKDKPVQRRHWFNQLVLDPQADGSVRSTAYVLVVRTTPGTAQPEIWPSCQINDVLEVEGDRILMRSRVVTYDHLDW